MTLKIDLNALKSNYEKNTKSPEDLKVGQNKQEDNNPIENPISIEDDIETKQGDTIENETVIEQAEKEGESLTQNKVDSNEQVENIKKENNNNTIIKDLKEKEEKVIPIDMEKVFEGYESDFKKNTGNVLKKIEKLKNLPKTRVGLLVMLILTAFGILGLLFYLDPKHHSLSIYKNLIVEKITGKIKVEDVIPEQNNNSETQKVSTNNTASSSTNNNESNEIDIGGFKIEYKTSGSGESEIINYEGEIFKSKEEFNQKVEKIIQEKRKEKLKDFFKKQ